MNIDPLQLMNLQGETQFSADKNPMVFQSELTRSFDQLLSSMLIDPEADINSTTGLMNANMFSPLMLSLYEQLLAASLSSESSSFMIGDAFGIHINQFEAEKSIGGDGRNANCGPTALAISLHALGLSVSGESPFANNGQIVDLARKSMIKDSGRDGIDASGGRSESEHSTYTNLGDIARGARAAGAGALEIGADANSVLNMLMSGSKVVVSGTFSGKTPLPWMGDRAHDQNTAPGGATDHIIAVTGYDPSSRSFIINDPARITPLMVSAETLEHFTHGNAGALAISR